MTQVKVISMAQFGTLMVSKEGVNSMFQAGVFFIAE
jgi:hypothetical protein